VSKEIRLGGKYGEGRVAIVDDDDYERVSKYNWWCNNEGYAVAKRRINGRFKQIKMHRFILCEPEGKIVDHANRDRLDNRKVNLRITDKSGNAWNKKKVHQSPYKYKGIGIEKRGPTPRYKARVAVYNERISLGAYSTEIEAAKAYNVAAEFFQGEYALLNDVDYKGFVIDISGPSVVFEKIVANDMYRRLFDARLLSINGVTRDTEEIA